MEKNRRMNDKVQEGQGAQKTKPSKEEIIADRIRRAQDESYALVSRRALETSAMANMVSRNDTLVNTLRSKIGLDERIDAVKGLALLRKNQKLRDEMNLQNAELSRLLGFDYRPPQGYRNPLAAHQAVKEEKAEKDIASPPIDTQEVAVTA